jgi:flagellar biosynthetic protein FlhB
MAENDGKERTESPTQKRLDEARKKGQVPRSRGTDNACCISP